MVCRSTFHQHKFYQVTKTVEPNKFILITGRYICKFSIVLISIQENRVKTTMIIYHSSYLINHSQM